MVLRSWFLDPGRSQQHSPRTLPRVPCRFSRGGREENADRKRVFLFLHGRRKHFGVRGGVVHQPPQDVSVHDD